MMRFRLYLLVVLTAVLAGAVLQTPAAAQSPTTNPSPDEVNAVAKQLYCPVCENIPLDVCPTQACAQWRDLIRQQLSQGWTDEQIVDYFVRQYGDRVRATPPARGLNWIVYVAPPVLILIGVYILLRVLRGMREGQQPSAEAGEPTPPPPSAPAGADDDYLKRLEQELKKRE